MAMASALTCVGSFAASRSANLLRSPKRGAHASVSVNRSRTFVPRAALASAPADDVAEATREWLRLDFADWTREAVQKLESEGTPESEAELRAIFSSRLEFGTAGLRGEMGAGYNRMNDLVVLQTTQGLAAYLLEQCPDAKERGVVIGFDGRHHSRDFARVAAGALLATGIKVHLFGDLVPTPLVAFGVSHLNAAAGICVTASHNPKQYNGYKVYWGNGCQIIPPHDSGIAAAIDANLEPWEGVVAANDLAVHSLVSDPTDAVSEAYFSRVSSQVCFRNGDVASAAPVTYTPLHGVGAPFARRMFSEFSLPPFIPVECQMAPDPEFSTVTFPNPEEGRATWAESFSTANAAGATICIANDPDADRLAAAEKDATTGHWRSFSGNEIGALLAHWMWINWKKRNPGRDPATAAMLASAVSSKMLGAMAAKEGFQFEETLTGFKWLGNVAKRIESESEGKTEVIFAFEEAIGFMFGTVACDKDGLSAAAAFCEMAAELAEEGKTVAQHLEWLYDEYGCHVGRQGYFVADAPAASRAFFDRLRGPGGMPEKIGPLAVESVRDLGTGEDTAAADGRATLPWTLGDMMITFRLEGGAELTLRASGTEPKLKYYLEVRAERRAEAEEAAEAVEDAVWDELIGGLPGLNKSPTAV